MLLQRSFLYLSINQPVDLLINEQLAGFTVVD